jgi:hypothetical protein
VVWCSRIGGEDPGALGKFGAVVIVDDDSSLTPDTRRGSYSCTGGFDIGAVPVPVAGKRKWEVYEAFRGGA